MSVVDVDGLLQLDHAELLDVPSNALHWVQLIPLGYDLVDEVVVLVGVVPAVLALGDRLVLWKAEPAGSFFCPVFVGEADGRPAAGALILGPAGAGANLPQRTSVRVGGGCEWPKAAADGSIQEQCKCKECHHDDGSPNNSSSHDDLLQSVLQGGLAGLLLELEAHHDDHDDQHDDEPVREEPVETSAEDVLEEPAERGGCGVPEADLGDHLDGFLASADGDQVHLGVHLFEAGLDREERHDEHVPAEDPHDPPDLALLAVFHRTAFREQGWVWSGTTAAMGGHGSAPNLANSCSCKCSPKGRSSSYAKGYICRNIQKVIA